MQRHKFAAVLVVAMGASLANAQPARKTPPPAKRLGDDRILFPLATAAFAPDGKSIVTAEANGRCWVTVVDTQTGKIVRELSGHEGHVNQIVFSPDGKRLYTGGNLHGAGMGYADSTLLVWDAKTGTKLHSMNANFWDLNRDGEQLVTVENTYGSNMPPDPTPSMYTVVLRSPTDGKERKRWTTTGTMLSSISFSPDGKSLALGQTDQTIRIVRLADRKEIAVLPSQKKGAKINLDLEPTWLAFHPNGKALASVSDSNVNVGWHRTIQIWNLETGKVSRQIHDIWGRIDGLAYTPKGDQLVVGGAVFDAATGERKNKNEGHREFGLLMAFYKFGRTPADQHLRIKFVDHLWDTATGQNIRSEETPRSSCFDGHHRRR